jgi:hypothetical protein
MNAESVKRAAALLCKQSYLKAMLAKEQQYRVNYLPLYKSNWDYAEIVNYIDADRVIKAALTTELEKTEFELRELGVELR